MAAGIVYAFDRFTLDARARELRRDGRRFVLSDRYLSVLLHLAAHAGTTVAKDDLVTAGWGDVAVTDNSLEQAISVLRRALGHDAAGRPFVETVPRQGYRLTADVTRSVAPDAEASVDALLAPHRAWIDGRAMLESLAGDRIRQARTVFEQVVTTMPDHAPAQVGLANACALQFEMTRADAIPDLDALRRAAEHARLACRLDADYGEAWATLGFILERTGHHDDALAAARRALVLEPDNWRHHLRLASIAWGEERLRAARHALTLFPGCPLAHWLAATVLVARQRLDAAARELEAGIMAGDAQPAEARFGGVALHWLLGLVLMADGDEQEAAAAFQRELAGESTGHLYARECCANTWYAIGVLRLRHREPDLAADAFRDAIRRVPAHPLARLGLALASGEPGAGAATAIPTALATRPFEAVLVEATAHAWKGDHAIAAARMAATLAALPPGSAGWLLPVEPLLHVASAPDVWAPVLALIRHRAA